MSVSCQSYFTFKNPCENIDKNHELFTLVTLFNIFKELYSDLFKVNDGPGCPKIYIPDIMVPFIQWGHLNKIISCRDLEKWWMRNDDTCNIVLDCKKPGKSSINECLNDYSSIIDAFDIFIVDFSLKIGLIGGKLEYHDGTILKGYCNNFNKLYANQLYYLRDFILEHRNKTDKDGLWYKLDKYFNKNEYKDDVEPILKDLKKEIRASGINMLKNVFTSKNGLKKVLLKIKQMEENVNGNQPISVTDPEAHIMLDKKNKMGFNYNYQTTTDNKFGMIPSHYITQNPNDKKELPVIIKELYERLDEKDFILVTDNGYWHIDSLKEIHYSPTMIIIPDNSGAKRKKDKINIQNGKIIEKSYKKHEFEKLWCLDAYLCPNDSILTRGKNIKQNGIEYKTYSTDNCLKCSDHDKCTKQNKRILKDRDDPVLDGIKMLYESELGQELYNGRSAYAEGNFATLLESRNFRGIKNRGTQRVNDELTLCAITHNIKKIHKHTKLNVLKTILNLIKKEKKKHMNVSIDILDDLIEDYVFEDDVLVDLVLK